MKAELSLPLAIVAQLKWKMIWPKSRVISNGISARIAQLGILQNSLD